jgi:hypothetical protein
LWLVQKTKLLAAVARDNEMGAEKLNHLDQKASSIGLHVRAELRPQSITRPTRTTEHVFSKMPGQQKLRCLRI